MSLRPFCVICLFVAACQGRPDAPEASTASAAQEPASTSPTLSTLAGISLGTPADTVLARRGKGTSSQKVGSDADGLLVEWQYPDGIYLMGRREVDGISAYRVIAIRGSVGSSAGAKLSPVESGGAQRLQVTPDTGVRTLALLHASSLGARYRLEAGDRWAVQNGEFNNTIRIPALESSMFEVTTRGTSIVGAGVMFLGTTVLDPSQRAFVGDLIGWLDQDTASAKLLNRISTNVTRSVSQIMQAPAIQTSSLTIHAGNVGGDVVVSIQLK